MDIAEPVFQNVGEADEDRQVDAAQHQRIDQFLQIDRARWIFLAAVPSGLLIAVIVFVQASGAIAYSIIVPLFDCRDAGVRPRYVDLGGGLPPPALSAPRVISRIFTEVSSMKMSRMPVSLKSRKVVSSVMLATFCWLRAAITATALVSIGMVSGLMFWGAFNTALELTNTEKFCTSCHEMRDNVFAEYKGTIHDQFGHSYTVVDLNDTLSSLLFVLAVLNQQAGDSGAQRGLAGLQREADLPTRLLCFSILCQSERAVDGIPELRQRRRQVLRLFRSAMRRRKLLLCEQRGIPWSVFRVISDRATDGSVDEEVFRLSNQDGTPNAGAIAGAAATKSSRMRLVTSSWKAPSFRYDHM